MSNLLPKSKIAHPMEVLWVSWHTDWACPVPIGPLEFLTAFVLGLGGLGYGLGLDNYIF